MMKRFLVLMACLFTAVAMGVGQNYDHHMKDLKVFRINLGSSRAPSTNEIVTYGLLPGTFVINTYDDTTYIVLGSSNTLGMTSSGVLTFDSFGTVDATTLTSMTVVTLATTGDGVVSGEVATVVESVAEMKSTVITFTNVVLVATDTSDEGESQEVYVFDDGAFTLLGAVINASVISSPGATGATVYVACGTVAAGDDADLTGTEADIIPRTTLDTATASTNDFDAILATNIIFDGTSTAIRIHVNFAIADDQMDADNTNTFSGTLTLYYTKPIDNQ